VVKVVAEFNSLALTVPSLSVSLGLCCPRHGAL
jgi:hypothetical protein